MIEDVGKVGTAQYSRRYNIFYCVEWRVDAGLACDDGRYGGTFYLRMRAFKAGPGGQSAVRWQHAGTMAKMKQLVSWLASCGTEQPEATRIVNNLGYTKAGTLATLAKASMAVQHKMRGTAPPSRGTGCGERDG